MENQFLDPTSELSKVSGQIQTLETKRNDLLFNLQLVGWIQNYVVEVKDIEQISSGLISNETQGISVYLERLGDLEKRKRELLLQVSPEHPRVLQLDEEIAEIRGELLNDLDNVIKRLRYKLNNVESEYKTLLSRFLLLPEKESEFSKLNRQYEIKEAFFQNLLDKQSEVAIAKAGIVSDYLVLAKAGEAKKPIAPNGPLLWMIALSIASILSLLIVAIRYVLHSTIISLEDIKRITDVPVLGIVPSVSNEFPISTIVVNHNPKSLVSESFRSLRANLKFINSDRVSEGPKTLAVTSTISGEGKTFVAINLGAILSFLDKKVILLDLDMRRPRLSAIFNVENSRGMSTILIGNDTLEDCVYQTKLPNLHFITSGPIPPNPAELILSEKFNDIVEGLKADYDYIIIDTPPIGLVTDGLEVIKSVDYPMYIFRADYSNRAFVGNVNKLVNENDIDHLSIVLNDFGRGVSGYYYGYGGYGYGYSYSYGGYYSDEKVKEKTFVRKIFKGNDDEE